MRRRWWIVVVTVAALMIAGRLVWLWAFPSSLLLEIHVPSYPVPEHNTYPDLLVAAECVALDGRAIEAAWYDRAPPSETGPILDRHRGLLKAIHEALAGECLQPFAAGVGSDVTRRTKVSNVQLLVGLAGRDAIGRDDGGQAAEALLDCVRLSGVLIRNGVFLDVFRGLVMLARSEQLLREILAARILTGEQLAQIAQALDTAWQERVPLSDTLALDWSLRRSCCQVMFARCRGPMDRIEIRRRRAEQDAAYARFIPWARQSVWLRGPAPVARIHLPGSWAFDRLLEGLARKVSQRDRVLTEMRVLTAAERFRLKHGKQPKDAAELVPEFLEKMPLDPLTGKPVAWTAAAKGLELQWAKEGTGKAKARP